MYCPDCGAKNSSTQRFCRSCGLGLEKITQSLAEQRPSKVDESLQARKERLERLGVAALSVFGLGLGGFALYTLFVNALAAQGVLWATIITLAVFIVAGCGLLSAILFAKANELKESPAANPQKEFNSPTTAELLPEAHPEAIFSVTERTTDLLKIEKTEQ